MNTDCRIHAGQIALANAFTPGWQKGKLRDFGEGCNPQKGPFPESGTGSTALRG